MENFALDQTEQFLKPQTFLDLIYLLITVIWWLSAVLLQDNTLFRASMFFILIGLFFFIPFYVFISKDEKIAASPINRAIKAVIFFGLILFFTSNKQPVLDIWDTLFPGILITFAETERLFICLLIPIAILMKSFSFQTLKYGYLQYIGKIFQGFWFAVLVLIIFKGINLYVPVPSIKIDLEMVFLVGYGIFLFGNLLSGPIIDHKSSITDTNLFDMYMAFKTRTERIRDALITGSFLIIILLLLPDWIISYREIFQYIAFIGLIIGIILIFVPRNSTKQRFSSLASSISGITIDPSSQIGSRIQSFALTIQKTDFQRSEKVYTIPSDGLKLVSKGKTTLSAAKGSIAVPTVTEKGTALVVLGKSEMKSESEQQLASTQEIDGTTTLWIPQDEWDDIELQLNPKNVTELTENELMAVGLNNTNEIFEKAQKAFQDLKSWRGPKGLFSSVLDDTTSSKYSITETKDYSLVRLPGVFVFESKDIELVNVLGGLVKVIEIKGVGEYVQIFGGFVTVLETPEYEFVQTPFVSVLQTSKGEVVKVFGIKIQEGEGIDIAEVRKRIIEDQEKFNSLFSRKIETIFQEDPHLLLTEFKGEKLGFIVGKDEVIGDTGESSKLQKKKQEKSRVHGKKRFHTQTKVITSSAFVKPVVSHINNDQQSKFITLNLNSEGIPTNHPELNEIEEALKDIELSIDKIDQKLIDDELSENKHTEMIKRLKIKQEQLIERKKNLINDLKLKFV